MKTYSLRIGEQTFSARVVEYTETKVVVELNGNTYEVELAGEKVTAPPAAPVPSRSNRDKKRPPAPPPANWVKGHAAPSAGPGAITAPIPGAVKEIRVSVGDKVTEGTIVLLLEAMKMENEIPSRVSGTVSDIKIGVGDSVQEGQLLIEIEVE